MNVEARQQIERTIVEKIIDSAFSQGYAISINNGGDEHEISKSRDKEKILEAMFATDEETMFFHVCEFSPLSKTENKLVQIFSEESFWVSLIYGNDGYDVIHDYLVNAHSEGVLPTVEKYIQTLEEEANV